MGCRLAIRRRNPRWIPARSPAVSAGCRAGTGQRERCNQNLVQHLFYVAIEPGAHGLVKCGQHPHRRGNGGRWPPPAAARIDWALMATARGTVRDLRRHNRSATLRALLVDGPLSRAEVSRRTGLSLATIGNVATELLADRLIVEAGQVDSDGGRPRVLLRVDPGYGTLIGVDVGAGTVTAELFDLG